MNDPANPHHRDVASLRVLGLFFVILGGLVLIGTLWTLGDVRSVVVNVASGAVLVAVGVGMQYAARRLSRRG